MSKKVYGKFDKAGFEVLASDPGANLFQGRLYYNSTTNKLRVYTGVAWADVSAGGGGGVGFGGGGEQWLSTAASAGWTNIGSAYIQVPDTDGIHIVARNITGTADPIEVVAPQSPTQGMKFTVTRASPNGPGALDDCPLVVRGASKFLFADTADAATDTIYDSTATRLPHGFANNDQVRLVGVGYSDAIGPFSPATTYYVIVVDANTIKLAASSGGPAIDVTSTFNDWFFVYHLTSKFSGAASYMFNFNDLLSLNPVVSSKSFIYDPSGLWVVV